MRRTEFFLLFYFFPLFYGPLASIRKTCGNEDVPLKVPTRKLILSIGVVETYDAIRKGTTGVVLCLECVMF